MSLPNCESVHDVANQNLLANNDYRELYLTGAITYNNFTVPTNLPIVLDDLGCNGNETNLLECLPQHNCNELTESAGVRCLLKRMHSHNKFINIVTKSWFIAVID